jgi:predicted small lipoprotein YifL
MFMKKFFALLLAAIMCFALAGCGGSSKEVKFPSVDAKLQSGGNTLNYSTYKESASGDKKELSVDLDYSGSVLTNGQTKAITNILDSELGRKYSKITVTIMEEKPQHDFVKFEYDGSEFKRIE